MVFCVKERYITFSITKNYINTDYCTISMTATVIARKWGNSLGIALPKELVEKQNIKEGDKLVLPIVIKKADLSKIFGSIKTGMKGQKFKDMAREGWGND